MEWLNYHHLRYFWTVAREGSLARASEKLRISQPSISEQIHELESAIGEPLFRRDGRKKVLTETGQIVYGYAGEIFALGTELLNAVQQKPGARTLRMCVGVADSFPKLVTNEILKPVFSMPQPVHVVCREGKVEDLVAQLATHRLDIILCDEPVSSTVNVKVFNHPLGETATTFCAEKKLAASLRGRFPKSLHGAPALLPSENTPFRRTLETWFRELEIQPRVVAEFEDLALMKVMASEGRGFIAVPSLAISDAVDHYQFAIIGQSARCRVQFHAVTAERRVTHAAVALITETARRKLDPL